MYLRVGGDSVIETEAERRKNPLFSENLSLKKLNENLLLIFFITFLIQPPTVRLLGEKSAELAFSDF